MEPVWETHVLCVEDFLAFLLLKDVTVSLLLHYRKKKSAFNALLSPVFIVFLISCCPASDHTTELLLFPGVSLTDMWQLSCNESELIDPFSIIQYVP